MADFPTDDKGRRAARLSWMLSTVVDAVEANAKGNPRRMIACIEEIERECRRLTRAPRPTYLTRVH